MRYFEGPKTLLNGMMVILAALAIALMAACGGQHLPPGASPEAKVAVYARQVVTISDGALTALDQLTAARLSTATTPEQQEKVKSQTRAAAKVLLQVGEAGKQLGLALDVWHSARLAGAGEQSAAGKVRAVLAELVRLMPQVTEPIDDPTIRAGVNIALQAFSTIFLNISSELPATAAG